MQELFENLGINGKLLLAQAVNFLILFFILQKVVFKRLFAFLEQRKQRIEKGLELTSKAEREMERISEAKKRELQQARKQGEEIMGEYKIQASRQAKETTARAKREAENVLLQAKKDAQAAKQDALLSARDEMKQAVLLVAGKLASRTMTKEEEERLAKEAVKEIDHLYA